MTEKKRNMWMILVIGILILLGVIAGILGKFSKRETEESQQSLNSKITEQVSETASTDQNAQLQQMLKGYFEKFYEVMRKDSTRKFSKEEFSSVNGYIYAKNVEFMREMYKKSASMGGIYNTHVDEIKVKNIIKEGDTLEVTVYVRYTYAYGDTSAKNQSRVGSLIKVTILNKDGKYRVQDLDGDSTEVRMAKEYISGVDDPQDVYYMVDQYYADLLKQVVE